MARPKTRIGRLREWFSGERYRRYHQIKTARFAAKVERALKKLDESDAELQRMLDSCSDPLERIRIINARFQLGFVRLQVPR